MARAPIHPGGHPADELSRLHLSGAALSPQLKVPTKRITGIPTATRPPASTLPDSDRRRHEDS